MKITQKQILIKDLVVKMTNQQSSTVDKRMTEFSWRKDINYEIQNQN